MDINMRMSMKLFTVGFVSALLLALSTLIIVIYYILPIHPDTNNKYIPGIYKCIYVYTCEYIIL